MRRKKIMRRWRNAACGKGAVNYKYATGFSRQRYWGEPFPIIWGGRQSPLLRKRTSVVPRRLEDYKPTGTGEPPGLSKAKDWIRYSEKSDARN